MAEDRTQPPPGFEWVPEKEIADDELGTEWLRVSEPLFDAICSLVQVFGDHTREWMTPSEARVRHAALLALLGGTRAP